MKQRNHILLVIYIQLLLYNKQTIRSLWRSQGVGGDCPPDRNSAPFFPPNEITLCTEVYAEPPLWVPFSPPAHPWAPLPPPHFEKSGYAPGELQTFTETNINAKKSIQNYSHAEPIFNKLYVCVYISVYVRNLQTPVWSYRLGYYKGPFTTTCWGADAKKGPLIFWPL